MAQNDFSTVEIAPLMDELCEAHDVAVVRAGHDTRWQNAIDSAWGWLLQQDAVSYDHATHALRVESATEPGKVYISNGDCQCRAFEQHAACWHRASARLMRRALELAAMAEAHDLAVEAEERRAAELVAEAHEDGCAWYSVREGVEGARDRMPELAAFASAWDAQAAELRTQAAVFAVKCDLAAVRGTLSALVERTRTV